MTFADEECREIAGDRRVVRTRKAIRRALTEMLRECDYDKVTIAALARKADIDRKTFYLHYDSVDSVADEIARERAEKVVAMLRDESFAQGEGVDVADLFARLSLALVQDYRIDERMMRHLPPSMLLDRIEGSLAEVLIEDDVLGLSSAMGQYLNYCVVFFCAGLIAVYRRWLFSDSEIPLEQLANATSAAIVSSIDGILRGADLTKRGD